VEKKTILLVGVKPEVESRIAEALGADRLSAAADVVQARAALRKGAPAAAVVQVGDPPAAEAYELVQELAVEEIPVVVLGQLRDADSVLAALRARAREYLAAGEEADLVPRLQSLLQSAGELQLGQVTVLFPAKGGMGATSLGVHLAGAMVRAGRRVCLVDLDLEMGDVLSFLDLRGTYSLSDVAANTHRLDRDLLDASVPRHSSGIQVLSQCEKVGEGERLDPGKVGAVLRFLRQHYDEVVVDGVRDFGDLPLAALDLADRIVLVVTQEVPAVRCAQRCAAYFRELGYDAKRIVLVVNRFQKGSPITREVIEETVGLPVARVVGNDFQGLSRAVNRGVLLWEEAPRSVVARDVEALAAQLRPQAAAEAQTSLLKRIFSPRVAIHGFD
jgi:pilus assembly protein CpaE